MPERLFTLYMALVAALILLLMLWAWELAIVDGLWRSMRLFLELVPGAAFGR